MNLYNYIFQRPIYSMMTDCLGWTRGELIIPVVYHSFWTQFFAEVVESLLPVMYHLHE